MSDIDDLIIREFDEPEELMRQWRQYGKALFEAAATIEKLDSDLCSRGLGRNLSTVAGFEGAHFTSQLYEMAAELGYTGVDKLADMDCGDSP